MKKTMMKRKSRDRDVLCQKPGCCNKATYEVFAKTNSTMQNLALCDYCIGPYVNREEGPNFRLTKLSREIMSHEQDQAFH